MPKTNTAPTIFLTDDLRWGIFKLIPERGYVEIGYLWNPQSGLLDYEETGVVLPADFDFSSTIMGHLAKALKPQRHKYWAESNRKPA
jgi:hypothetical protein